MSKESLKINLMLFGEGSASTGDGAANEGSAEAVQDQAKVVYGKATGNSEAPPLNTDAKAEKGITPEQREAEFEKLIKGDYKNTFQSRVQAIVDSQAKETKALEEKLAQAQPLLEVLAGKYGVDAADLESLAKAVQEDDSYFEQEAAEKGVSVAVLKEMKRIERENAQLRAAKEAREQQEHAQRVYGDWMKQAEALKSIYPSFDFEQEVGNEQFTRLLQAPGVDVRTAYEIVHRDEIIGGAMQHTAQTVAQKVVNNIAARGSRPAENGASSQGALVFKSDVNQLSKSDRKEILRRVEKGERIEF